MWLALDADGPKNQQLYRALRHQILEGALRPGARLPATRTLAKDLGLARNTVLTAFAQLIDEGYAVARTGSGTRVAATLPEERVTAPAPARGGARGTVRVPAGSSYARRPSRRHHVSSGRSAKAGSP